jgi:hypothetical protein
MKRTIAYALLIPAALALGLVACGGSGGNSALAPATGGSKPIVDPEINSASGGSQSISPDDSSIQLVIGTTIGTEYFPEGDTTTGAQGQAVDKFNCLKAVGGPGHHHVHVSLFNNGVQIAIPRGIGMKDPDSNNFIYHQTCLYFLHTHDETGIIHMEPKVGNGSFTLGNVFDVWGEPLTTTNVAGFTGPQLIIVNGQTYTGDPRLIQLAPFMQITIEMGTPLPGPPPTYLFPAGYP